MMRLLLVLFMGLSLVGCSIFSPVQIGPQTTYVINARPTVAIKRCPRPISLLVTELGTNSIYNTKQMAYSENYRQVAYFAKNGWADIPVKMLQRLIVQTLQDTHYFYAVSATPSIGHYDYILNIQLVELKQDFFEKSSSVRLTLQAQLVNYSSNHVLAARQFSIVEAAPENTPYGGVIAANRAASQILSKLARFCVDKI